MYKFLTKKKRIKWGPENNFSDRIKYHAIACLSSYPIVISAELPRASSASAGAPRLLTLSRPSLLQLRPATVLVQLLFKGQLVCLSLQVCHSFLLAIPMVAQKHFQRLHKTLHLVENLQFQSALPLPGVPIVLHSAGRERLLLGLFLSDCFLSQTVWCL